MEKLMQNKPVFFGAIGGVVLIIAVIIFLVMGGGGNELPPPASETEIKEDVNLVKVEDSGKALEVQSLLARQGIDTTTVTEGTGTSIVIPGPTKRGIRDRAIIAIVQSGLVDKNIGLEIFDKGDFTSSKEDKRIRLSRAINGELSRLIKRIPPIIDASVFVSIPEPTIFTEFQKPISATVQVSLPLGDKLDRDKERSIINLLLGSIQGLEAKNISLTDTNGNVYSSMMDPADDMLAILEENDQYMKKKIMVQLDKLIGPGKYVVTVSTFLRQSPKKTDQLIYDPEHSSVSAKQVFSEDLGDSESQKKIMSGAVSSFIPGGLPGGPQSNSKRDYKRSAEETQYGLGKTTISETVMPGSVEEISIAITVDEGSMPAGLSMDDFKSLVARTASPKVNMDNVEVGFSKPQQAKLASSVTAELPQPEDSGNPWYAAAIALGVILICGLVVIWVRATSLATKQQNMIQQLQQVASSQEQQLQNAQQQTQQIYGYQEELARQLQDVQAPPKVTSQDISAALAELRDTLEESSDELEVAHQLRNWIEAGQ